MAIYSCNISNVSRAKGSSSCATLSYISGEKVRDERLGKSFRYGREERVILTETLLPEGAPVEFQNPAVLFNAIENYETAENARTAKKIMVALPKEFDLIMQKKVVDEFIEKQITSRGYACSYAIHHDKENMNPHAHILIANRQIDKKTGEWTAKRKMEYALDEQGARIPIIDPSTGKQKVDKRNRKQWKRINAEQNVLDKKEVLQNMRASWAEVCNQYLDQEHQIDHRSHETRGIDQEPTIHEGYEARAIEASGKASDRCQINRDIKERNELLTQVQEQLKVLEEEIQKLKEQEKLLNLLEELQTENEQLRNQIQMTSSENLKLKKELQKKSDQIIDLNKQQQELSSIATDRENKLLEQNKKLEDETNKLRNTTKSLNNDLGAEIEQRIKRQQEETLNLHKKALNDRFQKKKAELEKNYTEKVKLLEKQYSGSKRLMQALRVVAIISVLAIIVAIGAISQNRAIKKAEMLQDQIQEVNTADWYLCEKDMMVYTRLEEIYVPMDRMTLRSGRAVQVTQIGEKWVEIKSQGKIGYIRRSDFDESFSEISLNIG